MGAEEIIIFVNYILGIAFRLWEKAEQIAKPEQIPTWEEISDKNARLQAKIDAEMV